MATYVFKINGSTRSIMEGWSITESANGRNRMECRIFLPAGTGRPSLDDEITFTENGTTIFAGLLDRPLESGVGGLTKTAAIEIALSLTDFNVFASRIRLTVDIPAGNYKALLTVVANALTAQGVTLDAGQVNGPSLPALSYVDAPLIDILNEGSTLADGYVWNINYAKVLSGTEPGTVSAPFNITDGDRNVVGDITVEQPRSSEYANWVTVYGGEGQRLVNDHVGDTNGTDVAWPLNYTAVQHFGYVNYAGTIVDGSIVGGVNETIGPGATWDFDPTPPGYVQRSGLPLPAFDPIYFPYMAQFPKAVMQNTGAPAAATVQKTYRFPKQFDKDVLTALAISLLDRDSQSPKTVRYKAALSKTGLHPGQTQTIASTKRNLSGTHLITDVTIQQLIGGHVQRSVTAVSSLRMPATLREQYQQTFGPHGPGGSAAAAPPAAVPTVSGIGGPPGTAGAIPRFAASGTLEDSPFGVWNAYGPSWTNVTVGNGNVVSTYARVGLIFAAEIVLTFGSTTTIASPARISLPGGNSGLSSGQVLGTGGLYDSSSGALYPASILVYDASNAVIYVGSSPLAPVSATAPFTWATGDQLTMNLAYQGV